MPNTARKHHSTVSVAAEVDDAIFIQDVNSKEVQPAFPLVAFLAPAKDVPSWVSISIVLLIGALFRWALGFWGVSGSLKPPMYGDFEAQRHWMEITTHVPVSSWYWYDLGWWGLDYPPLTAYHSWILGYIGNLINPSWFELDTSRGYESKSLKIYMRLTVLFSEYITLVPALILAVRQLRRLSRVISWEAVIAFTAILLQPGLLLIDHGHFQYNSVMLGFMVAAIAAMLHGNAPQSCLFFVAALGFKQMALFYAPAVFAYLLGTCLFPRLDVWRFTKIAIYTACAFLALYLPFLLGIAYDISRNVPTPYEHEVPPLLKMVPGSVVVRKFVYPYILQVTQSIHRIFPFSRGLFEDKVANIWCAIHASGLWKLHKYDSSILSRAALGVTLLAILPPCLVIFLRPQRQNILLAFATCAWGFFLCSYQVHEKNVLLPLLPMTLLLASEKGLSYDVRAWVGFANALGSWTMYPLLKRDGLSIPYAVLTLLWLWLLGLPPSSLSVYSSKFKGAKDLQSWIKIIHLLFYTVMMLWHLGELFVPAPGRFPHMWVVVNVVVGAGGFACCYLWCLWNLLIRSNVLSSFGYNNIVYADKKSQ